MKFVGLISGTSADGVDAVLLDVEEGTDARRPGVRQLGATHTPMPRWLADELREAMADRASTERVAHLRLHVTRAFILATDALLEATVTEPAEVTAIGCHGQTVWHRPPDEDDPGTSLQLLDPALLAAESGVPVVSDFRSADLAAGGHGAPLVAWSDALLFGDRGRVRALLNWGGIANVTRVAPGTDLPPLAFDLGPANALIDEACRRASRGAEAYDAGGARARAGRVDDALLDALLADPYFTREPPRSTGKEHFGAALVERVVGAWGQHGDETPDRSGRWNDLIRTFAELTVRTSAEGIRRWLPGADEVLVGGGGARNPVLLDGLAAALAPTPVRALTAADSPSGVDASSRESAAFALLAWAFLTGRPGNLPEATGAEGRRVLGSFTPAPDRPFRILPDPR
ncbi:MAG: anhydro-N-acetylmuramic acid kinase [Longimicrobiales bacterium]|nr:anhydro-N-acetylmuramic acid kinase [Longimicrobiales bacterium]